MSEATLYVKYQVAPQRATLNHMDNLETEGSNHASHSNSNKAVQEFLNNRDSKGEVPKGEVIDSYTETPESRRTTKWPQLQKALTVCKQRGATLLITELGTLASNESFTRVLLASTVPFHCVDQPFVNQTILEALSKHAEVQKKLHGKLIREGLKLTTAKSGNPNAAEVISKVNKPKIDTAIVFAFLLQPIIEDYRRKGFSQRQMVKALNEEGFTAPEGGKWVLSQLQKVLDRVRLNEVATELKPTLEKLNETETRAQIAITLNSKSIPPLKQPAWDEVQVKKLQDRIQQIQDITLINRFVLDLLPALHEYHRHRRLSPAEVLTIFAKAGMPIRQPRNHPNALVA